MLQKFLSWLIKRNYFWRLIERFLVKNKIYVSVFKILLWANRKVHWVFLFTDPQQLRAWYIFSVWWLNSPTMEKPQLVPSLLWRMTVLGYCSCLGSFCQNIQLGIKLDAPKLVSGPWQIVQSRFWPQFQSKSFSSETQILSAMLILTSMMTRVTLLRLMVALRVATAWEWVRPSRLASFTRSNKSPFWKQGLTDYKELLAAETSSLKKEFANIFNCWKECL